MKANLFLKNNFGRRKYQKLFEGMKPEKEALAFNVIFFVRRYFMILVITLLPNYRNTQIVCQLWSTLFMMSYISWVRPFEREGQNTLEIINEIIVLLASYHLFCFTEWIYDFERRWEIGWSLVMLIGLNVTINLTTQISRILRKYQAYICANTE